MSTLTMTHHHLVATDTYANALGAARFQSGEVGNATSSPAEIVAGGLADYYLSEDGQSGFVVRVDGELVGVFSLVKGRGDDIMIEAIAAGAEHLDCFDGYLPKFYARHGFIETERMANWTEGDPDVVLMARM